MSSQSNNYKERRAELSELKSEYGVLARTLEVLQGREETLQQSLAALESERGVTGFRSTQVQQ